MDTPLPNAAHPAAALPTDAAGLREGIVQKLTYDLG